MCWPSALFVPDWKEVFQCPLNSQRWHTPGYAQQQPIPASIQWKVNFRSAEFYAMRTTYCMLKGVDTFQQVGRHFGAVSRASTELCLSGLLPVHIDISCQMHAANTKGMLT